MSLTTEKIRRAAESALTISAAGALTRCEAAKAFEESGDYAAACEALGDLWRGVGARPRTEGLDRRTTAEVLLRAGVVSGFVGSTRQIEGAQEFAKDLISESAAIFEALGDQAKLGEAQTELAYCYWREGGTDEARVMLKEALAKLGGAPEQKAVALLRAAIVESSAMRNNDALRLLLEAAPLFEAGASHAKLGKLHMNLAIVFELLSIDERREDYADSAFIEYEAASFHLGRAGHTNYLAGVENNFGYFLCKLGRFAEAHERLDTARRFFVALGDAARAAQVDETRARVLLAEGRLAEAESIARSATRAFSCGGEQALLAETLTTQGVALARLGRKSEARAVLRRAASVAAQAGNVEGAGLAELAALEELSGELSPAETREAYRAADRAFARTQNRELLARLSACARRLVEEAAAGASRGAGVGGAEIEGFVAEACARFGKQVRFTPAACEAMMRLPLGADAARLRDLIERTVERAEEGAVVEPAAVATVALRQRAEGVDFADPWANFSFKDEVRSFEERLIEQALAEARGSVSRAARLLGFKHHESLNWRLKNRNKNLLPSRTPARKRRRSIIRKRDQ
ncbi:MAG TPA: helix-turn-helix domain-containing protein [Pyrinomonadaceae bacterium]|jgi:tetratricopeptide (TPR) repeat protein|nr:helix-turn-helix domain-containing protein [Pyrinomonadaceae bacterium]